MGAAEPTRMQKRSPDGLEYTSNGAADVATATLLSLCNTVGMAPSQQLGPNARWADGTAFVNANLDATVWLAFELQNTPNLLSAWLDNASWESTAVPVPPMLPLFGVAVLGVGLRRRVR